MNDLQGYRSRLQAYVLQLSKPEEVQSLEAEFFENDGLFALLIQTEEELVEDFEEGRLTAPDEHAFHEAMAQSPRLRELVALHRHALPQRVTEKRQAGAWLYYTISFVILATVACWLGYHSWTNSPPQKLMRAGAPSAPSQITAQLKTPGVRQGGASTGITIKVNPAIKELVLQLPSKSPSPGHFTASIRDVDNPTTIWQGNVLFDNKHNIFVVVPNFLKNNDYILTVSSNREVVAAFYFRLEISD